VSVVRMLIERGADVNAPRLPRRYSDGRKANAPSVGAAGKSYMLFLTWIRFNYLQGSTPLHFAAANGHAPIIQILLTCGATPDKSDKNGMTPEALAEVNGHTDVIRVLRVWEHLKLQESPSHHSSTGAINPGPSSERGDAISPSASTSQLGLDDESERYDSARSWKGKDRMMSFSSNISNAPSNRSQALRIKKSLEGLLKGRGSRSASAHSEGERGDASPRDGEPEAQPRLSTMSNETDRDTIISPVEVTTPTSPQSLREPDTSLDRVFSGTSAESSGLVRIASAASGASAPVLVPPTPPVIIGPPPTARRNTNPSSRRPSLPSILERAAHPGAAFRAAIRRDHEPKPRFSPDPRLSPPPIDETSPRSANSSGSFFRGRQKTYDAPARQAAARKYMSRQGLVQLFRRGQSPPSRSPSPPQRTESGTIIAPEELDEGIERLRRASFDLDMRESLEEGNDTIDLAEKAPRAPPASAPASKTRFFEDLDAPPVPFLSLSTYPYKRDDRSPLSANSSSSGRSGNRPRTGSEVIAPSPLANAWPHDEDSDSPPRRVIRRDNTQDSPSRGTSDPPTPQPTVITKPRAATLPGTLPPALEWHENADQRKVASGKFKRENELHEVEAEPEDADEVEDEEFHDALPEVVEPETGMEALDAKSMPDEVQPTDLPLQPDSFDDEEAFDEEDHFHDVEVEETLLVDAPPMVAPVEEPKEIEGLALGSFDRSEQQEPQEPPKAPARVMGRYRGASIGSIATNSSRISGSSLRMSSITDEASDRGSKKTAPPPPPPSVSSMADSRSRGISVSSTSTSTSGMGFSYMQSASTPGTSLTPQSTLSVHLTSGFPPVPEHEVAPHPLPRRKVSSRAEAADIVKQNEDDILQLAQLPASLDSSRSLAAQLAAYGENHAIEQEFAEREANGTIRSDLESSDNASFVSAGESAMSGMSSPRSSERASQFSGGRKCGSIVIPRRSEPDHCPLSSPTAKPAVYRCPAQVIRPVHQQHIRQACCSLSEAHDGPYLPSTHRSAIYLYSSRAITSTQYDSCRIMAQCRTYAWSIWRFHR